MIDEEQVRSITKKVLDEEHLLGLNKIFEKEHNIFRGSHDKIGLPETLVIPQPIVNQIVEKFDTKLTEGSIPFIDADGHFIEDNENLFYDEEKKILCLGLIDPDTDMVGGFCMKAVTPPTINIEDAIQVYALGSSLERLTDGGLEEWLTSTNLEYWTEFKSGFGAVTKEITEVHGGSFSCKLYTQAQGDYARIDQEFTLTPGNNCKVTVWYLRTAHEGSELRLYITDSGYNTYLKPDGTWTTDATILYLTATEVWKKFELEFTAHQSYSNYRIKLYKSHGSDGEVSFYVDDVSVAEGGGAIPYFRTSTGIVIGLNQDLRTTAEPTFAGLSLTNFSGVLKAVDGVVTGGAAHSDLADISSDQHHPQAHSLASHATKAHSELTNITSDQHHPQTHTLASHSTKPHSALTDVTPSQHHNQFHAASHHSGGGDAIKLDDLASPDDNVDLNASTAKHGLLMKLGGGTTNYLRADGNWAAPAGGNGATTFLGLTDTPANYTGAENKIVKVNATPDALIFGADISDLENVDPISGQAGKYARVKVGDAGIEWVAGTGAAAEIDFLDNFNDASLHWAWRIHNTDVNRTIVEAANKLTIAIAGGTNGNWWSTLNNAPKVITGIGRPPCEIITKLITVTTNNDTRCGIFVSSNPIGFGADYAMMITRRTIGGVESLQIQRSGTGYTAYVGAPFTDLPIWLKIRITADIHYGNHLRFYFSVNGTDWTELADPAGGYSDLLASDGFVVGLYAENWTAFNVISAEFDFFKVVPSLGADG